MNKIMLMGLVFVIKRLQTIQGFSKSTRLIV